MTDFEAADIIDLLKKFYPVFYTKRTDTELLEMAELWAIMFIDDDIRIVTAAVKAFIASDEKGFPPVPGQIRAKINLILDNGELTEAEAWGLIAKAIRNSAYHSREEFDKLPPILQKLVGSPNQLRDWANMPTETVHSVVASNVQRAFRTVSERERIYKALPPDVKELLTQIAAAKAMPELPREEPETLPPRVNGAKMPEHLRNTLRGLKAEQRLIPNPRMLPPPPPGPCANMTRAEQIELLRSGNFWERAERLLKNFQRRDVHD